MTRRTRRLARRLASHDAAIYGPKQRNDFNAGRRQCPNSVPNRDRTNENGPFPHVRARHDDGAHRAAARAEAAGPGRELPARRYRERLILHPVELRWVNPHVSLSVNGIVKERAEDGAAVWVMEMTSPGNLVRAGGWRRRRRGGQRATAATRNI